MRQRMLQCFLMLLLALRLTDGLAAAARSALAEEPKGTSVKMNADPGFFRWVETDFSWSDGKSAEIRLKMLRPNLGSVWAPMLSLCIKRKAGQENGDFCAQFFYSEVEHAINPRHLSRQTGGEKPSIESLAPAIARATS